MGQPVVDTLQLSDALRRTGMDRDQAEGIARAIGSELGDHIPVRGDLEALRSSIDARFLEVDAKIENVRSDIRALDTKFTAKFNVLGIGAGLALAFLAVLTGLNLLPREAPPAAAPVTVQFPLEGWSWSPPPPQGAGPARDSRAGASSPSG